MTFNPCQNEEQTHVHEVVGSVEIAEIPEDPHNHRFALISGEVIRQGNSHVHCIETRTDFYEDHFHLICVKTGPAIDVGDNRHVHFVKSVTTVVENHQHNFRVATLIQDPIGE